MAPSRDIHKARRAYQEGDVSATVAAHSVRAEEKHQHEHGQYLKSAVYGGLDGIVTTFAVVAGVGGAQLSTGVVLILGFANLVADGLSMAVGDYLSTKAELEYQRAERRREQWEVENYPEGEKRELVELYVEKGMPEDDAKTIAEIMSRHKETWIEVMMVEELGIVASGESPIKNAVVTFFSFAIFGLVPLAAFIAVLLVPLVKFDAFTVAGLLTAITLFALGAIKVRITGKNWFKSGLETLLVGGLAAAAAYAVGRLLGGLA
ncbi:MAG: VIT1/CCC1 transporter family protein [Thermoguttaceae bacterium]|jgi:VIT1/CCC1 family predicted Fe2+/Mn2+ transporter